MRGDAGRDERLARGEVREDLEGRVLALRARRGEDVRHREEGRQLGGRALPGEDRALAHSAGAGFRLHAGDFRGRAAHQQKLDVGHEGEGVEQQLDPLVGLEVPGVEDDRPGAESQLAAELRDGLRWRRASRVHQRRILDLEDGHLRRTGPHPVGQAGADGHRDDGVPQRVALEGLGHPEERPAGREARVAELVGDRRVHVHDERDTEEARERRDEVRRLLDRVDDIVAAEAQSPGGLEDEGHVEGHLGERRPGLHAPDREPQAAQVPDALDRRRLPPRERQQVHLVPERDQGPRHVQHGERRAPHLEERLGGEEEDAKGSTFVARVRRYRSTHPGRSWRRGVGQRPAWAQWLRKRSASIAAMQPVPAAVIAWR